MSKLPWPEILPTVDQSETSKGHSLVGKAKSEAESRKKLSGVEKRTRLAETRGRARVDTDQSKWLGAMLSVQR
jgi:hypothetical protein